MHSRLFVTRTLKLLIHKKNVLFKSTNEDFLTTIPIGSLHLLPTCYQSQLYLYNTHYLSQVAVILLALLGPEYECLMILENIGNHLPSNTASHPRRFLSLATWLCEPQLVQYTIHKTTLKKLSYCTGN